MSGTSGNEEAGSARPLRVELRRSGLEFDVQPGTSILHAILDHGVVTSFACERGECSLCAAVVLEGTPIHRDSVLTDAQRANEICTCVSWAEGERLVLDL